MDKHRKIKTVQDVINILTSLPPELEVVVSEEELSIIDIDTFEDKNGYIYTKILIK